MNEFLIHKVRIQNYLIIISKKCLEYFFLVELVRHGSFQRPSARTRSWWKSGQSRRSSCKIRHRPTFRGLIVHAPSMRRAHPMFCLNATSRRDSHPNDRKGTSVVREIHSHSLTYPPGRNLKIIRNFLNDFIVQSWNEIYTLSTEQIL